MQKSQFNKIKPLNKKSGLDFVSSGEKQRNSKLSISFKYFHPECIKTDNFNNHYENEQAARKATSDLIQTLKNISNEDVVDVFSGSKKHQLHLNKLQDKKSIELIDKVLLIGYSFPNRTVEEFEQEYFEIVADGDGGRVIFVREDNIIDPLFIDANHMICPNVSRALKKKMTFEHPGLLCFNQQQIDYYRKEEERAELLKLLLEDARKGRYNTVEDLLKEWDSINN